MPPLSSPRACGGILTATKTPRQQAGSKTKRQQAAALPEFTHPGQGAARVHQKLLRCTGVTITINERKQDARRRPTKNPVHPGPGLRLGDASAVGGSKATPSRCHGGGCASPRRRAPRRGLAQGERSPAIYCGSSKAAHSQDGRIGRVRDVNRRRGLALRQPPLRRHLATSPILSASLAPRAKRS